MLMRVERRDIVEARLWRKSQSIEPREDSLFLQHSMIEVDAMTWCFLQKIYFSDISATTRWRTFSVWGVCHQRCLMFSTVWSHCSFLPFLSCFVLLKERKTGRGRRFVVGTVGPCIVGGTCAGKVCGLYLLFIVRAVEMRSSMTMSCCHQRLWNKGKGTRHITIGP
jgi:hypothetical protein